MLVVLIGLLTLQADAFRVSTSPAADVQQETLQQITPGSTPTTEVFPGSYTSPYGVMVMRRIEEMLARVDETDRNALVQDNIGAGFDRSITLWRADPNGRTVALAVHYYRDRLLNLKVNVSDDYGRPEPIDPGEFQVFTVAVCSRAEGATWSCREDLLSAAARRHDLTLPMAGADRAAAVEKLLERVLAGK